MPRHGEDQALLASATSGQGLNEDEYSSKPPGMIRACLAELLVSFMFVLVGVTAVVNNTDAGRSPTVVDLVGIALTHGFMVFLLVSITAHVSGGHINPAVSFGVYLAGEISLVRFFLYTVSQLVGATLGGAMALGLNKDLASISYGTHHPNDVSDFQAFGIEIFTTFVLVSTVLSVAVERSGFRNIASLCIGLAVAAGILASGNLTGGSMNPARSLGPSVISLHAINRENFTREGTTYYDKYWKDQWIYLLAPMLGAFLASINFRLLICSHRLEKLHVL